MEIRCFQYTENGLKLVGVVDDYESFTFERSYSSIGSWSLTISAFSKNVVYLRACDIISAGEGCAGLLTGEVEVRNETYTFSGVELKGIAQKRIVYPPTGQAYLHYRLSPEEVIEKILETQITNAGSDRTIAGTIQRDSITSELITYDGRFGTVANEIMEIAQTYEIGWRADVVGNAIQWSIYHGKDRTIKQTSNSMFLITNEDAGPQLERTYHGYNNALVAGQGEGVGRSVIYVNDGVKGWNRTELYVDARDVEDATLLPQRGKEKLAEYGTENTLSIEPYNVLAKAYRTNYDLGDIGTLVEVGLDFRLTGITEVYENNEFSLSYEFGYDANTLSNKLKRMENNTATLMNKE